MSAPDNAPEQASPAPVSPEENSKEYNFSRLRHQNEELQDEIRQSQAVIEELRQKMQQAPEPSHSASDYSQYGIDQYGTVEGAKLIEVLQKESARNKAEAERIAARVAAQTYDQIEKSQYKKRLRDRYEDYDDVMSKENLAKMEQADPISTAAISALDNEYLRRELAYKKIKEMQHKERVAQPPAQALVDKNKNAAYHYAPGSVASTGQQENIDLRVFVNDSDAQAKAYQKLKEAQKRSLTQPGR